MADPTEDIVRKEITRARQILREDKLIQSHGELRDRLDKHFPDNSGTGDEPPPAPKPTEPKEPPKQSSLWWGDQT